MAIVLSFSFTVFYLTYRTLSTKLPSLLETIRKYGKEPFQIALLHGGPGAAGEMKPVAIELSDDYGVLELLQTGKSVDEQLNELHLQLNSSADLPVILIGYSWGAWLGFLFSSIYPNRVKKLILVSAGAFESKYNNNLMNIRYQRLNLQERKEVDRLISLINSGKYDNKSFEQFGNLMMIADSYDCFQGNNDSADWNIDVFKSVWTEASALRDTDKLINSADKIKCPVIAIHGDYDSHPFEGVEKPLTNKLLNFKMIKIEKCGHTPWRERYAKDKFFEILRKEIKM